ncbi:MAG: GNAT family N-acetyltransferase [Solirubrobacterales bacterium]
MQYDAAEFERAECRFRRDMWSTAPEDAVIEAGVRMRWFGPVLATTFAELPEIAGMSAIQGAAEPGAMEEGHLAEAIEWMGTWEVDYIVPVASDRPETHRAEQWLDEHGYEQRAVVRKYVRAASRPSLPDAPGVEVLELAPDEGEGMSFVAAEGLGLPDLAGILFYDLPSLESWRCYVALLEGELVACGAMLIDEGIATLGIDATVSHARGRGCNQALLRRRLIDAADAGCHAILAEACDEPRRGDSAVARNLRRVGFEEACRSVTWQRPVGIAVR